MNDIVLYYLPALALAAAGAITDIRSRRIPNLLCIALAVVGIATLALSAGVGALPWSLLIALVAVLTGMALFAAGMIGGGDAKFYAAAACGLPSQEWYHFLGWVSLSGLLLLFVMAISRRIAGKKVFKHGEWSVPYGVAIFAGFVLTVLQL